MIRLEQLRSQVEQQQDEALDRVRRSAERSRKRMESEAREEEKNGGYSFAEYMERYGDTDDEDEDAIRMVTNFTMAIIAVAERLER